LHDCEGCLVNERSVWSWERSVSGTGFRHSDRQLTRVAIGRAVGLFPSLRCADQLNEIKVRQMERAMEGSLDFIEKQIIDQKYLISQEINDLNIYGLGCEEGEVL
jgi:hypothetical protein